MNTSETDKTLRVRLAKSLLDRMIGLFANGALDGVDALMLAPCHSIHSFGMPDAIDVAFINKDGYVLKSLRDLAPCRLAACRGAWATLERFSDPHSEWLLPGDKIELFYPETADSSRLRRKGAKDEGLPLLPKHEF